MRIIAYTNGDTPCDLVGARFPDLDFRVITHEEELVRRLPEADALFLCRRLAAGVLEKAPKLRWIHVRGAGVDHLVPHMRGRRDIAVTRGRGVQGPIIAEYVLWALLTLVWQGKRLIENQANARWERWGAPRLGDLTVAVVGLGAIGTEVSATLAKHGTRLVGVSRHGNSHPIVTDVKGPGRLLEALSAADAAVICLPLTEETKGLIGAREISAMRPTSYLINVGRGGVVEELALVSALTRGLVAGATLDVFEEEPLPPESPLWTAPNLIVTPHIAAEERNREQAQVRLFADNLARFLEGRDLVNQVNLDLGY